MVDLPVLVPLVRVRAVRHLAFKHGLEGVGIDRTRKSQILRAPARPGARLPVGAIGLRVVAVLSVVGYALRGRGDHADRGYDPGLAPGASIHWFSASMVPGYAFSGPGTRAERPVSQACQRLSSIVFHPNIPLSRPSGSRALSVWAFQHSRGLVWCGARWRSAGNTATVR